MRFIDVLLKDDRIEDWVKESLDGVPVVSCDNVSKYFFEETDQEFWDMGDFPNIAPPFDAFWLDFNAPDKVVSKERGITIWKDPSPKFWGFLCFGIPLETEEARELYLASTAPEHRDYFTSIISSAKWGMDMYLHWQQNGLNFGPVWGWRMLIDDMGQVVKNPTNGQSTVSSRAISKEVKAFIDEFAREIGNEDEAQTQIYYHMLPYWHTALLAISFMHCKNVSLNDVKPPLQTVHNKSQRKRGVKPYQPVPYKILDIRPMKEVLKVEGHSESTGTKKALHICRGHFSHYTDKGLFGKYKGTYWIPQHVRGSKDQGITTKDYNIKL